MKDLGLAFRLDDLTHEPRRFSGQLSLEVLEACLPGLVGELGYRPIEAASVSGTAYRSSSADVIVEARLRVCVGCDCVRCLAGLEIPVDLRLDHVFVPRSEAGAEGAAELVVGDDDEDDEVLHYDGEGLDLTDTLREDLLLELPMNPSCSLADRACAPAPADTVATATVDPRWAPLLELRKKMREGGDEPPSH